MSAPENFGKDGLPVGSGNCNCAFELASLKHCYDLLEEHREATQAKLDKAIAALTRISESLGIEGVLASQCLADIGAKGDGK